MRINSMKISEIKPYGNNPRKNDAAVDKVANSISEFGFKQPIVVDQNHVIIAGHTRYKAAEKAAAQVWELSEREKEIIKKLSEGEVFGSD